MPPMPNAYGPVGMISADGMPSARAASNIMRCRYRSLSTNRFMTLRLSVFIRALPPAAHDIRDEDLFERHALDIVDFRAGTLVEPMQLGRVVAGRDRRELTAGGQLDDACRLG